MTEQTITAAVIISFTEELEDNSAALYREMAQRYPEHGEAFLGFARDCEKSKVTVVRTYQETITDAIEAAYSFQGMVMPERMFGVQLKPGQSLRDALAICSLLEENAVAFYTQVADRSASLLATIPGAFRRVARTRAQRKSKLGTISD